MMFHLIFILVHSFDIEYQPVDVRLDIIQTIYS